jgi:hypothetical protein
VIDTGTNAMASSGFIQEEQMASRGVNTFGGRRHTTPRARPMSPSRQPAQNINASAKVTVKKLE